MIIELLLCLIWAFVILIFTLNPLVYSFLKQEKEKNIPVFQNEHDLSQTILFRDQLIEKLIYADCKSLQILSLNDEEALNLLVIVCERLSKYGLAWDSQISIKNKTPENGFIKFSLLLIIILFSFLGLKCFAQESSLSVTQNTPIDLIIPAPIILPNDGYWLPAVNQFILIPNNAGLSVYYVGMFSNTFHAKSILLELPFPDDIEDLKIISANNIMLKNDGHTKNPLLNFPLSLGVNQIRAEFFLKAPMGFVYWHSTNLSTLSGLSLIFMPEYQGRLRSLLESFLPNINVWPARIIDLPTDFKSILSADSFNSSDDSLNKQMMRQFIRAGYNTSAYPTFRVVGLVASRIVIYVLSLFLFLFLVSTSLFLLRTHKRI